VELLCAVVGDPRDSGKYGNYGHVYRFCWQHKVERNAVWQANIPSTSRSFLRKVTRKINILASYFNSTGYHIVRRFQRQSVGDCAMWLQKLLTIQKNQQINDKFSDILKKHFSVKMSNGMFLKSRNFYFWDKRKIYQYLDFFRFLRVLDFWNVFIQRAFIRWRILVSASVQNIRLYHCSKLILRYI